MFAAVPIHNFHLDHLHFPRPRRQSYNMRNGIVAMIGQLISSSTASANGVSDAPADSVSATLTLTNKQRDGLLSVLAERIHDVTAFTRAAALKTWTLLAEYGARSI